MELKPIMGVQDQTISCTDIKQLVRWPLSSVQASLTLHMVVRSGNPSEGQKMMKERKKANFTQVLQPEINTCGTTSEPNKSVLSFCLK